MKQIIKNYIKSFCKSAEKWQRQLFLIRRYHELTEWFKKRTPKENKELKEVYNELFRKN